MQSWLGLCRSWLVFLSKWRWNEVDVETENQLSSVKNQPPENLAMYVSSLFLVPSSLFLLPCSFFLLLPLSLSRSHYLSIMIYYYYLLLLLLLLLCHYFSHFTYQIVNTFRPIFLLFVCRFPRFHALCISLFTFSPPLHISRIIILLKKNMIYIY